MSQSFTGPTGPPGQVTLAGVQTLYNKTMATGTEFTPGFVSIPGDPAVFKLSTLGSTNFITDSIMSIQGSFTGAGPLYGTLMLGQQENNDNSCYTMIGGGGGFGDTMISYNYDDFSPNSNHRLLIGCQSTIFQNTLPTSSGTDLVIASDGTLSLKASDARLKKNVVTLDPSLDVVNRMRPVKYTLKSNKELYEEYSGEPILSSIVNPTVEALREENSGIVLSNTNSDRMVGFLAQDFEALGLTELVTKSKCCTVHTDQSCDCYAKGVRYPELTAYLVSAVQELSGQVRELSNQVQMLLSKNVV